MMTIADLQVALEALADWPDDEHGPWTVLRTQAFVTRFAIGGRKWHVPLTPDSKFEYCGVIYTDDEPRGIGLQCARVVGTEIQVLQQALAPVHRGRGFHAEIQTTLQRYAFEVMKASVITFETMSKSVAAKMHVRNRAKYEIHTVRPSRLRIDEEIEAGRLTKEAWEAWYVEHEEDQLAYSDNRD